MSKLVQSVPTEAWPGSSLLAFSSHPGEFVTIKEPALGPEGQIPWTFSRDASAAEWGMGVGCRGTARGPARCGLECRGGGWTWGALEVGEIWSHLPVSPTRTTVPGNGGRGGPQVLRGRRLWSALPCSVCSIRSVQGEPGRVLQLLAPGHVDPLAAMPLVRGSGSSRDAAQRSVGVPGWPAGGVWSTRALPPGLGLSPPTGDFTCSRRPATRQVGPVYKAPC